MKCQLVPLTANAKQAGVPSLSVDMRVSAKREGAMEGNLITSPSLFMTQLR